MGPLGARNGGSFWGVTLGLHYGTLLGNRTLPWASTRLKTSYSTAFGFKRPERVGFRNLMPHFGGTLDVEGQAIKGSFQNITDPSEQTNRRGLGLI